MQSNVRATRIVKATNHERGITLIELLIAVSLVSLLSVGMLFAIRTGFTTYERIQAKLDGNRKVDAVQRILAEQITSLIPAQVECGAPGAPGLKATLFQGEPQMMRFVSSYSMTEAARGAARVLEYQVIPGERGRGVRLIVNETLYTGLRSEGANCLGIQVEPTTGQSLGRFLPTPVRPTSFVLADRLAACSIRYRRLLPNGVDAVWVPRWPEANLPTAIAVDMIPLEPDPSRPPVLSVTAPVRVTRVVVGKYADYE
jgi:general secretion pathway protein J